MSYYDGFAPAYTFHLSVEREDRTLLDAVITAAGSEDMADINQAKNSIVRLLNECIYKEEPQEVHVMVIGPESGPVADSPAAAEDPEPEEPAPPERRKPTEPEKPAGIKGVVKLVCNECGNVFHKLLADYQESVDCKCGNVIYLTDPNMARFSYNCPQCGAYRYGWTNLEDPEIEDSCSCGEIVKLKWDKQKRKYTENRELKT